MSYTVLRTSPRESLCLPVSEVFMKGCIQAPQHLCIGLYRPSVLLCHHSRESTFAMSISPCHPTVSQTVSGRYPCLLCECRDWKFPCQYYFSPYWRRAKFGINTKNFQPMLMKMYLCVFMIAIFPSSAYAYFR